MSITKNEARQGKIVAFVDFNLASFGDGATQAAIDLPANAVVLAGDVYVTTAFNAGTTAVLDVGDADTGNRYANDLNVGTTGKKALVPTGFKTTKPGAITLNFTQTGTAATVGAARLYVEYIVDGRSEFTQD